MQKNIFCDVIACVLYAKSTCVNNNIKMHFRRLIYGIVFKHLANPDPAVHRNLATGPKVYSCRCHFYKAYIKRR